MHKCPKIGRMGADSGGVKVKRIHLGLNTATPPKYAHDCRGVHPPEAMMHFLPVSDFPLFPKISQTQWKIFQISLFPENIFRFSSAKISDDLPLVVISSF